MLHKSARFITNKLKNYKKKCGLCFYMIIKQTERVMIAALYLAFKVNDVRRTAKSSEHAVAPQS